MLNVCQVRCLEALLGDKENARFLVGTTSLQKPNQVSMYLVAALLLLQQRPHTSRYALRCC